MTRKPTSIPILPPPPPPNTSLSFVRKGLLYGPVTQSACCGSGRPPRQSWGWTRTSATTLCGRTAACAFPCARCPPTAPSTTSSASTPGPLASIRRPISTCSSATCTAPSATTIASPTTWPAPSVSVPHGLWASWPLGLKASGPHGLLASWPHADGTGGRGISKAPGLELGRAYRGNLLGKVQSTHS